MDFQDNFQKSHSRRQVLKTLGVAAGAGMLGTKFLTSPVTAHTDASPERNPIQHILVFCQENRSFDQYFGHYEKAGKYGTPKDAYQLDAQGTTVYPYHFTSYENTDTDHSFQTTHVSYDGGKMDGFVLANGTKSMGYYVREDLPYYYSLADNFALCGNYFCYELGPTSPNRLGLWTGTSGGSTTNGTSSPLGTLNWPTIADLLDQYHISWKCYNVLNGSDPSISSPGIYNGLSYFQKWINDKRLLFTENDYHNDLKGDLPQVSFIITHGGIDEHPNTNPRGGMQKSASLISSLIASKYWTSSVFIQTYDEAGNFYDHVAPPQFDSYGLGMRVPTMVVSPWVKRGHISGQLYEHSSTLKFIERTFNLPTLASINHQFDEQTPVTYRNEAAAPGATSGPPAPPRDGVSQFGDFYEMFDFNQDPHYYPTLVSITAVGALTTGRGLDQFNYAGSGWQQYTNVQNVAIAPYNNSYCADSTTDDYVTFQFEGTQIQLYGAVGPDRGIGAVSIDGGKEIHIDFYSATADGQQILWTSPELHMRQHTLKLRVTGTKTPNSTGTIVALDHVEFNTPFDTRTLINNQ
jgi:phospholipase C